MKAFNTKLDKIMSFITIYDERVTRYETNMSELKESVGELKASVKNKNDTVTDALSKINKQQCTPKENSSYADKVKQNEPVILVVSKQNQTAQVTQKAIMDLMDPSEIPVENMRNTAKSTVVLEGRSKEDLEVIQKYATEKMGAAYEVKLSEMKKPKILISGISEKLTNDENIIKLKRQNKLIQDADLRVVSTFGKNIYLTLW